MTTGQRIKAARKAQHMTQSELAAKLGIPYQSISQYERDLRKPKHGTILKLANALNVMPDELYGIDEWIVSNATLIEYIGSSLGILKCILERPDITSEEIKLLIINSFPNFDELCDELGELSANIISASLLNPVKLLDNELTRKFLKLNDAGVKIALERIDELAEIPRYQYNAEDKQTADSSETPPAEE